MCSRITKSMEKQNDDKQESNRNTTDTSRSEYRQVQDKYKTLINDLYSIFNVLLNNYSNQLLSMQFDNELSSLYSIVYFIITITITLFNSLLYNYY